MYKPSSLKFNATCISFDFPIKVKRRQEYQWCVSRVYFIHLIELAFKAPLHDSIWNGSFTSSTLSFFLANHFDWTYMIPLKRKSVVVFILSHSISIHLLGILAQKNKLTNKQTNRNEDKKQNKNSFPFNCQTASKCCQEKKLTDDIS